MNQRQFELAETDYGDTPKVKPRYDGGGDGWAKAHREGLGNGFYMSDVDGIIGVVGFAANTEGLLFQEYVVEPSRELRTVRRFATVAMFDRKSTEKNAFCEKNEFGLAWYLDLCRRLGETQPRAPRFFFVIGSKEPPWTMIELDIDTSLEIDRQVITSGRNWRCIWDAIGLTTLRNELRSWIGKPTKA